VRAAVTAGPLESFSLTGQSQPVATWRLERVVKGARGLLSQLDSPLVARARERELLQQAFARVVEHRRSELVTVVGPAGIGKSRLAHDFAVRLLDAVALQGRCVPYGDGITYWPIIEIVRQAAEITESDDPAQARAKIRSLLPDTGEAELICAGVAAAVGLTDEPGRSEEAFWALRKLFEALAERHPLVLVVEDIHWAEPTLLDLLEYVAGWSKTVPMLLLCLARPELLEARPAWPGVIRLEPLESSATTELIGNLLGSTELDGVLVDRVADASDGNPLFVEQLLRMLIDDGLLREEDGAWRSSRAITRLDIPPTINALLSARLDQLAPGERTVLQRAAVAGKVFWWGAVSELSPADFRPEVGSHLHSLLRKKLIVPEETTGFTGEDGFRFGHILMRDAAYRAIPKGLRSELHERFADWLLGKAGSRDVECEELVGFHLEQAYRARAELGPVDDRGRELAARGGRLLGSAGSRAFARDDMPAALKLLDRAVSLVTADDPARLELMRGLSNAFWTVGELTRADLLLGELIDTARATGNRRLESYALLERSARRSTTEDDVEELLDVGAQAIRVFEDLGDDAGLARAWRRVSFAHRLRNQYGPAVEACERALRHARRVEGSQEEVRILDALCTSLLYGPTPVAEAIPRCESMFESGGSNRLLEAAIVTALAGLEAMRGRFERARELCDRARTIYHDLALRLPVAGLTQVSSAVELLADNPTAAEAELRLGYEILSTGGSTSALAAQAVLLADTLYLQGSNQEARLLLARTGDSAAGETLATQVRRRAVGAKLDDGEGFEGGAIDLAREAVVLANESDALTLRADAIMDLAEVLRRADRASDAVEATREALFLYEQKGNVVAARRASARLASAVTT